MDEDTKMGYLPSSFFDRLGKGHNSSQSIIEWGGEVSYPKADSISPQMGSGFLPKEGFGKAAFVQQLKYTNVDLETKSVADDLTVVSEYYSDSDGCYGIGNPSRDRDGEYIIFYGGPGFC